VDRQVEDAQSRTSRSLRIDPRIRINTLPVPDSITAKYTNRRSEIFESPGGREQAIVVIHDAHASALATSAA